MLVLVKKNEKETTPVDASEAQINALIATWGRPNVVDAASGEPFPEPVVEVVTPTATVDAQAEPAESADESVQPNETAAQDDQPNQQQQEAPLDEV